MKWKQSDEFTSYAVYHSVTKNAKDASLIAANINDGCFEVKKEGYYWVLATPKLSKTSKFYGENIPVAVNTYSFQLPISDVVFYKK